MTSIEREIGNLEARMQTVESELQAIRSDVRDIRDVLMGVQGGWRTLTIVIGIATTFGALLGRYLPSLGSLRP